MRTTGILLSLLLGAALPLGAQPMSENEFTTCKQLFARNARPFGTAMKDESQSRGTERFQESRLPLGASDVAPLVTSAATLVTGEKDGRGVATYSHNQQTSDGRTNDWSLSVSVPFSKSEGQAVFASPNGLSGDVVATGAFSRFGWDLEIQDYGDALCQVCKEQGVRLLDCDPDNLRIVLQNRGRTEQEINEAIGDLGELLFGTATAWFWGFEASAGRKERSFFEPAGTKSKEDRIGHSFSLTGGWLLGSGHLYLKATEKRDFKDKASATLCTPITGSVLESCSSLPLGEADKVDSTIGSAEYRWFFPRLAISPSAQFDFEESIWGFQLPVFLTRDGSGKFTGGVRFAWRSDERDLITTVFVSRGLEGMP